MHFDQVLRSCITGGRRAETNLPVPNVVAGQKIGVGISHAGLTVSVYPTDTSLRVQDGDQLLVEVPRTATKPIARFKARKPEPSRSGQPRTMES